MAKTNPVEPRKALEGAEYPADRDSPASVAEENGADGGLVEKISGLGEKRFSGPDKAEKAVFDKE